MIKPWMAQRPRDDGAANRSVSLLLVRCGPYRLGFPTERIGGVAGSGEIVPVRLPSLRGVLWREGVLLPVALMAPLLGLPEPAGEMDGHGVLVHSSAGSVCLMVDEVLDLVDAPAHAIKPLPPLVVAATMAGIGSAALAGGLALILDPVRVLGPERAARMVDAAQMASQARGSAHV